MRKTPSFLSPLWAPPLITLLALALRVARLDFQPLWWDEGWSLYFATSNLPAMLARTAEDIHPPFYYALLHGWITLFGPGPVAVRTLSVLVGTLTVPVLYALGRRLFGPAAGLLAALVIAVAPLHVYYSQEVRMYGLVTLLGLLSTYFFVRLLEGESARRTLWAGYLLTTALALYTQYYAVFIPIFQTVFVLARHFGQPLAKAEPPTQDIGRRLTQINADFFFPMGEGLPTEPLPPRSETFGEPAMGENLRKSASPFPLRWLAGQAALVILYLPWLIYAGPRLVAYVQNKAAIEGYLPWGLYTFFDRYLTAFSLGHLPDSYRALYWATALFLSLTALGAAGYTIPRLYPNDAPRPTSHVLRFTLLLCYLLIPLFLGYLVNLRFPFTPIYAERTLLLAAPAYYLLVGLGLAWLWERRRPAAVVAALSLICVSGLSLYGFYTVPRYPDDDYRPLISQIRATACPQDVVLCVHPWQVGYFHSYYPEPRPRLYAVPSAEWAADPARMQRDLDQLMAAHGRLWLPAHQTLGRMLENDVEEYLTTAHYPLLSRWFGRSTKLTAYAAATTVPAGRSVNFDNRLRVLEAGLGDAPLAQGQGVIAVELLWQMVAPLDGPHRLTLRLADDQGRVWAQWDGQPKLGLYPFSAWSPGQTVRDRHGLTVPPGTPPGPYRVRLEVYRAGDLRPLPVLDENLIHRGNEAILGTVQVGPSACQPPAEALPIQHPRRADLAPPGQPPVVRFLGYDGQVSSGTPGQPLDVTLYWQALTDVTDDYVVFLQLLDEGGKPVALRETPPVGGAYPTTRWSAGELVRDPHRLSLPAALPDGRYRLVAGLFRAGDKARLRVVAGQGRGDDSLTLAEVQVVGRPHDYRRPAVSHPLDARLGPHVALVGYDLNTQTVGPGGQLHLTLYWQALGTPPTSYKVFVHLLDAEKRIRGQRDSIPGGGDLPTTGWVEGEYLRDEYDVPVDETAPAGRYLLAVGMYDPDSGLRLPVTDAAGQPQGDQLLLADAPVRVEP